MAAPPPRPLYSRNDLEELRTLDRAGIFEALGSFAEGDLSEQEFAQQAAALLDADAIPGLAQARESGETAAILDAVHQACRSRGPDTGNVSVAPEEAEQAERVLGNLFTFYDEPHQLPESIDWDHNPGTAHWGHDLNRFGYLTPLTRVHLATGEARFARKAVGLILDWIGKADFGKCFVGTPYVFGSYLNEAIHCTAWARCVQTLLPHDQVKPIELLRVLKSLHDHLAYLEIVTNGHGGNWPTIGCSGILATLAVFPVFRDTERFISYCKRTFAEQIDDQVLPDGVQDELTPHYHRCVINNLTNAIRACQALGHSLEGRTLAALRKMVHYQQQTNVPDGSAHAAFNDGDPGVALDVAPQLAEVGLEGYLSPPERLGRELFPYAGVAFLRQRQTEGDLYLAFDGGPFGRGHQHEDRLGFWLFAYGRNFIVDPGRHLYDVSEVSYLPHLRGTHAHSTITIDDQAQHSRGRPETWIAREPVPFDWNVSESEIRAAAAYDLGYGDDNAIEVVHRREIVFVQERFWVVFDLVEGDGEHRIDSRFQFAPGPLDLEGTQARTGFDDANLLLWAAPETPFDDVQIEEGQENPRAGWYSSRYGLIEPAPCLHFSVTTRLPFFAATLLFPYKGDEPPAVLLELGGQTVTVEAEDTGRVQVSSCLRPIHDP